MPSPSRPFHPLHGARLPLPPRVHGALLGAGAALLASALGCGPADGPPPADGGQQAQAPEGQEPLLIDPSLLVDPEAQAEAVPAGPREYDHPLLGFREVSDGLPESGTWLGQPTLADFDGDGDLDLVASNREEDGVSTWRFTPGAPWERCIDGLPRTMSYGPTHALDLDHDGKLDLLVGDHALGLRGFLGDGALHWTESSASWPRPNLLKDIDSADLDGDGLRDVVTLGHFKGGIDVYQGTAEGGLVSLNGSRRTLSSKEFGHRVQLADFDNDGVPDIAVASNHGLKVFLAVLQRDDLSWEEHSEGLPVPSIGNSIYGLETARFDESRAAPQIACAILGDPGVARDERVNLAVYAYDPAAKSWSAIDRGLDRGDDHRDVHAADFDGDGHTDLIVCGIDSGRLIYLGDGKGGFRPVGRVEGHGKSRLAVGDIDGDGLPDVIACTAGQKGSKIPGRIRAFLNDAALWKR